MDPLLVDPAAADYHIDPTSPAAYAGLSPALVLNDFEGKCYRDPSSIGAFEVPDAIAVSLFVEDFGRTDCTGHCEADYNVDGDVDGSDLAKYIVHFDAPGCP